MVVLLIGMRENRDKILKEKWRVLFWPSWVSGAKKTTKWRCEVLMFESELIGKNKTKDISQGIISTGMIFEVLEIDDVI